MLVHVFLSALMALSLFMYYAGARYKGKKQKAYANDERWKSIVNAARVAVYRYHVVLLALVVLGYGVSRMFDFDILISLHNVFGLLCLLLLSGSIVELIALLFYDRNM